MQAIIGGHPIEPFPHLRNSPHSGREYKIVAKFIIQEIICKLKIFELKCPGETIIKIQKFIH